MASRPYISHSLDKLYELYHRHSSELPVLEKLYAELEFRKRNHNAPAFRLEVEATIEGIKRDIVATQVESIPSIEPEQNVSTRNSRNKKNDDDCFALVQVSVNLRRIVARTAHIHEYKLSRLNPEFYRHMDENEQAMIAKVVRKLKSSKEHVTAGELPKSKRESTAVTAKEPSSKLTKKSLLKELEVPSRLAGAKSAILTFQSDITLGDLDRLKSSTLKNSGCWGKLSYTLLSSLRDFYQRELWRSSQKSNNADGNQAKQTQAAITPRKPTSSSVNTQPKSNVNVTAAPSPNTKATDNTYLRQLEVPRRLAGAKAAIINFKQNITLGELDKLKSSELKSSGCWVNMSYTCLAELREYCQKAIKRSANSLKASASKSNHQGATKAATYATLLAATSVPKDVEGARSKILRIRPSITLGDLKYLKNKRLGIKPDDFDALKKFCHELLKSPPAAKGTAAKVTTTPADSDEDILSPLLKDIPVRGKLGPTKDSILKMESGIRVNQLKSLRGHDSLNLSPKALHELRLFCCQYISGQGRVISGEYNGVNDKKSTVGSEMDVVQPSHEKPILTVDSLLTDLAFPEELTNILAKADPYLPLRATVQDLLDKGDYALGSVTAKDAAKLKSFVRKGLQRDISSNSKLVSATQEDFFNVPVTSSAILDAPPGCGKTHSIVERLAAHVAALNTPYDAKEILVLSFTRNAVNEIKQRLHRHAEKTGDSKLYYVRVMTFDSLAYRTLDRLGGSPTGDFDANITRLKSLLITGDAPDEGVLSSLRWLYVDEYQDLVGCRADLVLELVKKALSKKGGAYLLGDPCQQIMNFQIKNKADTDNATFIKNFKAQTGNTLVELGLEKSYRFKTEEQKERVSRLRSELLDYKNECIRPSKFAPTKRGLAAVNSETAILCPRNIDTHLIADRLREYGIECHVNTGAEKHTAPRWLFDTFGGWEDDSMSASLFREKCRKRLGTDGETELKYLRRMGVNDGRAINVRLIVDKIENSGGLPDTPSKTAVVVSTVHKAKGLQYKNVMLLCDGEEPLEHGSDELYAFYVAVTRAQEQFELLAPDELQKLRTGRSKIYRYRDCVYLEGLHEISLPSILADEANLTEEEIGYLAKEEASYRIVSDGGMVHLVARLYSGRELKLYRLPRLERFNYKKDETLLIDGIRPSEFSTFIYTAENYKTERLLGPTCMIALPVFTGLWKYKYV
ncbi:hypothetical protein RJ45_22955 [Photobacterium gaetbulicola]|uniref:DNA 3'-5' helicase II n=1 Tax=Photobacterium gaetbulicola TaxID=1295392 RepID=A0A0B9FXP5_9GAMM|nr:UvrD-helicase domain-containing protein [Photobacterium gaetbulicola]KHT60904.1 hypothetical protein RJ45_22955 [Photobacterium gaetbulicola]